MKDILTGSLVHLSCNTGSIKSHVDVLTFDEKLWDEIVEETEKSGQNTIFIGLGDGIIYGSHPELAIPGAWSRQRVKREVKRLQEKGITLIPKLNFSTFHDDWLGEYGRMPASPTYYKVCKDLILEVCDLFQAPYFHLGMDEEFPNSIHVFDQLGIVRQNELFWHDLHFLFDCVRKGGATPIMWDTVAVKKYEQFKKNVSPDDAVMFQYYYHAVKKEHWTRIDSKEIYKEFYSTREPYKYMNLTYVEEDPYYVDFRKNGYQLWQDGYHFMIGISCYYQNEYNTDDVIELYAKEAPKEQLKGYFTLPWLRTLPENRDAWIKSIHDLSSTLNKYNVV